MKIIKALESLLIDVEWSMTDDDLSTLVIHTKGIKAPTQKEIDDEILRLENAKIELAATKAGVLERLGITEDEAKALLS